MQISSSEQPSPLYPSRSPSPTSTSPSHSRSYAQFKPNPHEIIPVPWRRLIPLSFFPVSEAMTYAVLFPFVTAMITSFGVDPSRVGLCAGIGEGVMMLVEAIMAPLWARMADRYGRRSMLLLGFSTCVLACPMVGFSETVWQLIIWRACLIYKTTTAEISHPFNRAQIVSLYSPSFSLGMVLGTFLGGHLANPSGRLPAILGGTSDFWVRHPYALPCVVVGGLNAFTLLNGLLFLHETQRTSPSLSTTTTTTTTHAKGKFRLTSKVPGFLRIITIYLLFQITTYSWEAMFTIWTYTSPDQGGLGLAVDTIGTVFAVSYLFTVLIYPFALPRIQRWLGLVRALRLVLGVWPILAVLMPVAQWAAVHARGMMWGVMGVQLVLRAMGTFAWALCEILMINCFDQYPELMATGSAITLISGAGGRALGPMVAGWIFSISTQYPTGSFLRQISWLYMLALTLPALLLSRSIKQDEDRPKREEYEAVPMLEVEDGR